jgi:hypothetical protein
VVHRPGRSYSFRFEPEATRVVIVGSVDHADVKIQDAAAIAFYLERDRDALWLTAAYDQRKLKLNQRKVPGRCRLSKHAVVELNGVQLDLCIRDTAPTLDPVRHALFEAHEPPSGVVPIGRILMSAGDACRSVPVPLPRPAAHAEGVAEGFRAMARETTLTAVPSLLARLGVLARRRPLLVFVGATIGSLLLVVLLAATRRIVELL